MFSNMVSTMPDVQSSPDSRHFPIQQVGIKALRFPIVVPTSGSLQHTIAQIGMTVFLPENVKGTHMSRFVTLMEEQQSTPIDLAQLRVLTQTMLARLNSHSGKISMSFPFFRQKSAPVTGMKSLLDYDVTYIHEIKNGTEFFTLKLLVPVTSLCPCSKEISQYGAHNQRSHVTITLRTQTALDLEQLIDLVEQCGSSQLYGLLKRPDEKFVTEQAYENPKFVEDIVRDVAVALQKNQNIQSFEVESENFESIHNHSAYAYISYP